MSPKYRVLLAVLLTLLAICSQVVFGQTKIVQKIVHVGSKTLDVGLNSLQPKNCSTGPGAISITPSGGTGKYTFAWTGPAGFKSTLEDISGLEDGTYTVQASDESGCSITKSWTVALTCASTCSLLDAAAITNSKTCSSADGSIMVTVSGGSGSYVYTWYDKNFNIIRNTKDLTGVVAGPYYLQVTDSKTAGCSTFFYYTIGSSFKLNYTSSLNTRCAAPFTGLIATTITGGSGNYTYQWQHPDGTKTTGGSSLTGIRSGSYSVTVQDNISGCSATENIYIGNSSAAALVLSETVTPSTSCDPGNGAVNLTVGSGSGSYTFTWTNQSTGVFAGNTEDLANAKASNYSVYVMDNASGCNTFKQFVVSDLAQKPAFTTSKTDNTQCGAPFNGAIDLSFTTSGQYNVAWTQGATTQDAAGLAPGRYGVTVTDQVTGCKTVLTDTDDNAIVIADLSPQPLAVSLEATDNSQCASPNGSIEANIEAVPSSNISTSWTGPDGFVSTVKDLTGLDSGTYILTVTLQCNAAPVIESQALITQINSTIKLNLRDIISDPDNNLDASTVAIIDMPQSGARASISNLQLDIYYQNSFVGTDNLRIRACDMLGVCAENTISVEVKIENGIVVFNAVAPLSNGDNKFMRIEHLPSGDNRVSVYNRWGDKVFETKNYTNEIPGRRFEGLSDGGKPLPSGTYFYKIELADASSPLTGYLSLKQ